MIKMKGALLFFSYSLFILCIDPMNVSAIGVSPTNITNNELYIYNDLNEPTSIQITSVLIEEKTILLKANQRKKITLDPQRSGQGLLNIISNSKLKQHIQIPITTNFQQTPKFNYTPILIVIIINIMASGVSLYLWKTKRFLQ